MSVETSELSERKWREENLQAISDVAPRKDQTCQMNPDRVQAKPRTVIRSNERLPGDSVGARDAYGEARWKSREERIGATMRSIEAGHGW